MATSPPVRPSSDVEAVGHLKSSYDALLREIGKVIVGQDAVIEQLLISLLARGHCLLIGVPGLAKTLLIRTLAQVLDLKFSRIQFTPDLMPSDITGTEILEDNRTAGTKSFKFIKGPVFANILLADEINRTPPKTQSALLEAMQEHHVTAAGVCYKLDEPFFVFATQNPIEMEGTYPLPEAQLDRFMFNVSIGYLPEDDEVAVVRQTTTTEPEPIAKVFSGEDLLRFHSVVRKVPTAEDVVRYAVRLAAASRPAPGALDFVNEWVTWGAGLRASQYMVLGAKARALLDLPLGFSPAVFSGTEFPKADFLNPERAENIIGEYSIKSTFYNAAMEPVATAKEPGRYGAVVEIRTAEGRSLRRFRTLYRTSKEVDWWPLEFPIRVEWPAGVGIDPIVAAEQAPAADRALKPLLTSAFERGDGADLLSFLSETKPGERPADRSARGRARAVLAPPRPEMADLITAVHLRIVLETMRQDFDIVVVDALKGLNDQVLAVRLKAAGALLRLNDSSGISLLSELAQSEHAAIRIANCSSLRDE